MNTKINWMQQGWECPKCGAIMAPHVDCCVNCRGNKGGGTATAIGATVDYNFKVIPQSTTGETDMLQKHTETPDEQWERYYLNL